ncbi:MAG: tetratricopeptide repeat protein [Cyclobacteriaceae bacterium]|nr:tetratricopeptide repeat protein [Cyclobacteriaceae bacterium]
MKKQGLSLPDQLTIVRLTWLIAIFFYYTSGLQAFAQGRFSKFFSPQLGPPVDIKEYLDIPFKWNLPGKTQAYLNSGITELKEGSVQLAIQNFTEAIDLTPHWAAYYYRGVCYKNEQRFKEAKADFQRAVKLNGELYQAHLAIGIITFVEEGHFSAEKHFTKAIKVNPESEHAYYFLGNNNFWYDQKKAREMYHKALVINPNFSNAHLALAILSMTADQPNDLIMEYLNRAVESDSTNQKALFWRGFYLANNDLYEESLADLNALIRYSRMNPLFIYLRGILNVLRRDFVGAYNDLKTTLTLTEEDESRFKGQQTTLDKKIDLQSIIYYLDRDIFGFTDYDIEQIQRGFCMLLLRNYQEALNSFYRVQTNTGLINYLIGLSFEHAGAHKLAFDHYNQACNSDAEIHDAFKKRGIYQLELKRYQYATADFTEMIRLQPYSKGGYKLRGTGYALDEKFPAAIQDLTVFIESDSTDENAFSTRAYCYEKNNQWKLAASDSEIVLKFKKNEEIQLKNTIIRYYEQAIAQDPDDQETQFRYSKFLLSQYQSKSALKQMSTLAASGYSPAVTYMAAYSKGK